MTPDELNKWQKAMRIRLGEPFAGGTTDELAKTRLRLLVFSGIAIAIVVAKLRIGPSSVLGLQIDNLDASVLRMGLGIIVGYLLVHFVWGSADSFAEWRLRLTGTRRFDNNTARQGGPAQGIDYLPDERQSTLYSWWLRLTMDAALQTTREAKLEAITAGMSTARITESLERFDRWYLYLQRSQSMRWLLFDLVLPILIGVAAILFLAWPWIQSQLPCSCPAASLA